jgi:hypothetical protein
MHNISEEYQNRSMIAILGSHPATVMQTPFDDPSVFIYACSPHNFEHRRLPRFDAWCELHRPIEDPTRAFAYLNYVSTLPVVWMRDKRAMTSGCFKGARPYPEKEMKDRFGPFTFTSSIAYILAKAIDDCEKHGIKQIGLWGIMQASQNEYAYQRPGLQNLIWEATKSGIKVIAPQESKLFEPPNEKW